MPSCCAARAAGARRWPASCCWSPACCGRCARGPSRRRPTRIRTDKRPKIGIHLRANAGVVSWSHPRRGSPRRSHASSPHRPDRGAAGRDRRRRRNALVAVPRQAARAGALRRGAGAPKPHAAVRAAGRAGPNHPIEPLAAASAPQPLPALDESDGVVQAALAELIGKQAVMAFLQRRRLRAPHRRHDRQPGAAACRATAVAGAARRRAASACRAPASRADRAGQRSALRTLRRAGRLGRAVAGGGAVPAPLPAVPAGLRRARLPRATSTTGWSR